jgi:ribosome modulation factor
MVQLGTARKQQDRTELSRNYRNGKTGETRDSCTTNLYKTENEDLNPYPAKVENMVIS